VKVHLLVTVRNPDLIGAATMVWNTIRIGFPTADIHATFNDVSIHHRSVLHDYLQSAGAERVSSNCFPLDHHHWILSLIEKETEPFWICDTDICFWQNFERFEFKGAALAGRYTPQFYCSFANARTCPRLHTCLLRIDPSEVKVLVKLYGEQFPDTYCTPRPTLADLIFPRYTPYRFGAIQKKYFSDTCSLLYAAIGGQMFTNEQNSAFDHLNFGTLCDVVAPRLGGSVREMHAAVLDQPHLLKGQWKRDQEFYRNAYAE
jgi:hypothetical protein